MAGVSGGDEAVLGVPYFGRRWLVDRDASLRAGVHPKVVSERLGHASVAFTLSVYTASIPAMDRNAADTVAALFVDDPEVGED